MAWLYILYSEKDGKFYLGQTGRDIHVRIAEHQAGYVKATKTRRPLKFAYAKEFSRPEEVKRKEWQLKQPSGYLEKRALVQYVLSHRDSWPLMEK